MLIQPTFKVYKTEYFCSLIWWKHISKWIFCVFKLPLRKCYSVFLVKTLLRRILNCRKILNFIVNLSNATWLADYASEVCCTFEIMRDLVHRYCMWETVLYVFNFYLGHIKLFGQNNFSRCIFAFNEWHCIVNEKWPFCIIFESLWS